MRLGFGTEVNKTNNIVNQAFNAFRKKTQKHMHLLQKTAISYWSLFCIRCMFLFINISILKLSSNSDNRLARKTSFPVEKRHSTAALDGIAVLYLITNSIKTGSPRNAASVKESFDFESTPSSDQILSFVFQRLVVFGLFFSLNNTAKNSSSTSSLLLLPLMLTLSFSFESLSLCNLSDEKWTKLITQNHDNIQCNGLKLTEVKKTLNIFLV